jgi:hypothetical protein
LNYKVVISLQINPVKTTMVSYNSWNSSFKEAWSIAFAKVLFLPGATTAEPAFITFR